MNDAEAKVETFDNEAKFAPIECCWICGCAEGTSVYPATFALSQFAVQDPPLAAYSGATISMKRCAHCKFIQPEALPTLTNYFDRLYDQRWSHEGIEREFDSHYKDMIFYSILHELKRRVSRRLNNKRLLDIGAHVGRFLHLSACHGWAPEGIELNPLTSAYAARRTGFPVHRMNAAKLGSANERYGAITLTDVLEHIPDPLLIVRTAALLLEPGGWLAIKVPCASSQLAKERVLASLGCRDFTNQLASNLVHVSHFSPASLRLALQKCGFRQITVTVGAPELFDSRFQPGWKNRFSTIFRRSVYYSARALPWGIHTPLALHLQAYAQKDG